MSVEMLRLELFLFYIHSEHKTILSCRHKEHRLKKKLLQLNSFTSSVKW